MHDYIYEVLCRAKVPGFTYSELLLGIENSI
jgi:hypothetical protein